MINAKSTIEAIQKAYENGGYVVMQREGEVLLFAGIFAFRLKEEEIPEDILQRIREHVGQTPEEGKAYFCLHSIPTGDYLPEHLENGWNSIAIPAEAAKQTASKAGFTMAGTEGWKLDESMKVFFVDPVLAGVLPADVSPKATAMKDGRVLLSFAPAEGSLVVVSGELPE